MVNCANTGRNAARLQNSERLQDSAAKPRPQSKDTTNADVPLPSSRPLAPRGDGPRYLQSSTRKRCDHWDFLTSANRPAVGTATPLAHGSPAMKWTVDAGLVSPILGECHVGEPSANHGRGPRCLSVRTELEKQTTQEPVSPLRPQHVGSIWNHSPALFTMTAGSGSIKRCRDARVMGSVSTLASDIATCEERARKTHWLLLHTMVPQRPEDGPARHARHHQSKVEQDRHAAGDEVEEMRNKLIPVLANIQKQALQIATRILLLLAGGALHKRTQRREELDALEIAGSKADKGRRPTSPSSPTNEAERWFRVQVGRRSCRRGVGARTALCAW